MGEEGTAVCLGWGSILLTVEVRCPNSWWDFSFPINVVVTLLHMYHSGYWTRQLRSPHFMYHSYRHLVLQLTCAQQVGSSGSSLSHL